MLRGQTMAKLTNYQMSYLFSLETHRRAYPVISWIEQRIVKNSFYGEGGKNIIEQVRVSCPGEEDIYYGITEGKVTCVLTGDKSHNFFSDPTNPLKEEFDLIEVIQPQHYQWLRLVCMGLPNFFRSPHSCTLYNVIKESPCEGCGTWGEVNYATGEELKYFCGGRPGCLP